MNDSYGELTSRVVWVTGSSRARTVRFFVSDDASWITGITVDVAGGATMVR